MFEFKGPCKEETTEAAYRLNLSQFVKDMILQLLVKGDAVGFKRYAQSGRDIDELVCVNPVSVKVKYARGELTEARQFPEETGAGEPIPLPVDQVIHLKWDAPAFTPRGNSLVLPAFQSIELLRDYRRPPGRAGHRQALDHAFPAAQGGRRLRPEDNAVPMHGAVVIKLRTRIVACSPSLSRTSGREPSR